MTTEDMTPDQLRTALCAEQWRRERAEGRAALTIDERVAAAEASEATMLATLTAAQAASTRDLDGARAARRELAAVRVLLDAATAELGEQIERSHQSARDMVRTCAEWLRSEHDPDASGWESDALRAADELSHVVETLDAIRDSQRSVGQAAIAPLLAIRDEVDGATNPRCYHPTSAMGCTLCDREWRLAEHEEALAKLRPYFGKLKPERGDIGTSHWDDARAAFEILEGEKETT